VRVRGYAAAPQALHCAPQKGGVSKAVIVASKAIVSIVKKPSCPLWLKKQARKAHRLPSAVNLN